MSLKIYFCGSIRAGQDDTPLYAKIIQHLKQYGTVLTEHVGRLTAVQDEQAEHKDMDECQRSLHIHNKDVAWLQEADVVVAEVTQPSLGVGYEVGRAVAFNKPIMCMFRPSSGKKLSCMIQGAHNGSSFIVKHYQEPEAFQVVDEFFAGLKK